jgi:hypothetical protein
MICKVNTEHDSRTIEDTLRNVGELLLIHTVDHPRRLQYKKCFERYNKSLQRYLNYIIPVIILDNRANLYNNPVHKATYHRQVKIKLKLSLCLTKHHAMEKYDSRIF